MPLVPVASKSKAKAQSCRPKRKKSSVGKWRVVGNMLIPKKQALLDYCSKLSSLPPEDPIITFHFPSTSKTVQVHKSRLTIVGGPLRALVNNGFAESAQSHINLSEADNVDVFSVLTSFLYLKRINMSSVASIDLALAAHRWQLHDLFEAYFVHARMTHAAGAVEGLTKFFPLLRRIDIPSRFRTYLAVNIALHFDHILHDLTMGSENLNIQQSVNATQATWQNVPAIDRRRSERLKNKGQEKDDAAMKRPRSTQPAICSNAVSFGDNCTITTRTAKRSVHIVAPGRSAKKRLRLAYSPLHQQGAGASSSNACTLQPNEEDVFWIMLQSQNMLSHVIRYVSRFSKQDHSALFLDVVLRQLEANLSDKEVIQLLLHLDWESVGYVSAVKEATTADWSPRAFRLLAVAQSGILSRGDGISEMKLTWTFKKVPQIVKERSNMLIKSEPFPYNGHKFVLSLACSDCSSGYLAPLIVRIVLNANGNVNNIPKNVMAWVRVRAIESGCGCDATPLAGKRYFQGMTGRGAHSNTDGNIMLKAFTEGSGEPFVLLDSGEFRHWLDQHQPSCSLLVQAQLRFKTVDNESQAQRRRNDFGLNAQHRALMRSQLAGNGRRRCDCGLPHDHSHDSSDSESSDGSSFSSISDPMAGMDSEPPFFDLSDDDDFFSD